MLRAFTVVSHGQELLVSIALWSQPILSASMENFPGAGDDSEQY
jgi:hypothetical protein